MTKPKRILTMIALTILGVGLTFLFAWVLDVRIDSKYVAIQSIMTMYLIAIQLCLIFGWAWATDGRD